MFKNKALVAIAIVVFVDLLGYSIILPLLAFYAKTFNASPQTTGYLVAVYSICQFIASPILGSMSDRFGRRPLLIYSQIGSFLGFILLGLANTLPLLFLSRVIDGLSGGNLTIAQAYIADITPPKERAGALAIIGIAFGVGFTIGPFLGGTLMEHVGPWAPAFLAAAFSLCSTLLSTFYLKEHQHVPDPNAKRGLRSYTRIFEYLGIRSGFGKAASSVLLLALLALSAFEWNIGIGSFTQVPVLLPLLGILMVATIWLAFSRPREEMRTLLVIFLYFALPFSLYVSMFSLFAMIELSFSAQQVGMFLAFVGLLGILWQGVVIRPLIRKAGERVPLRIALVCMSLGLFGIVFARSWLGLGVVAIVFSFGSGITRPIVTSMLTQVAPPNRKGGVLGVSTSLDSLSRSISPILGGWIIGTLHPNYIGYLGGLLAMVGVALSMTVHADAHEIARGAVE